MVSITVCTIAENTVASVAGVSGSRKLSFRLSLKRQLHTLENNMSRSVIFKAVFQSTLQNCRKLVSKLLVFPKGGGAGEVMILISAIFVSMILETVFVHFIFTVY